MTLIGCQCCNKWQMAISLGWVQKQKSHRSCLAGVPALESDAFLDKPNKNQQKRKKLKASRLPHFWRKSPMCAGGCGCAQLSSVGVGVLRPPNCSSLQWTPSLLACLRNQTSSSDVYPSGKLTTQNTRPRLQMFITWTLCFYGRCSHHWSCVTVI